MKDYDYHRPAEKVLLDSYRKQNRNKNRLLFLAVALTVGVIFCMISFAYGKIQVDIQKHIRTDGMTVSTYLENGTEEMAGQLHTLSYIAETGKEKFAGKLCDQTIKYCDCVVADETAFETMLCPAYTQIIGTYPKQENEIMLSTKTLTYLGISDPKVGMELKLDFYWNDLFQTKGTGQQTFQLSGYFTEYQNQGGKFFHCIFIREETERKRSWMESLQDTAETGKGFCQWHTDGTTVAGRYPVERRAADRQHGFGCIPGSGRNAGKLWICSLVLFPDSAVYVFVHL